jgi:hypothetical protein
MAGLGNHPQTAQKSPSRVSRSAETAIPDRMQRLQSHLDGHQRLPLQRMPPHIQWC